jgi:FMN phosphatase YigB (HAD superfamily)
MDPETPPQPDQRPTLDRPAIEERKLRAIYNELPDEAREAIGPLQIKQVGDAGFIVQRINHAPMAGNDWVLYDYDDTIAATTAAKSPRLEQFIAYAQERFPELDGDTCAALMKATDTFSRWEDLPEAGKNYHTHTHVTVLNWAVQKTGEIMASGKPPGEALAEVKAILDRIQAGGATEDDPFYIREKDQKFVSRKGSVRNVDLEQIFATTLAHPDLYDEVLESMRELAKSPDSIHRTNVGIITYGEPHYQLRKLFTMLQENPDLPLSQIMLTNIQKGDFIKQVIESGVEKQFSVNYVPAELDEDGGFGSLGTGGQLFSESDHNVIIFDDDPTQLENIAASAQEVKDKSGARVITVRSIRPGTKAENKPGQTMTSEFGSIDFRNRTGNDLSISDILLINRYLAVKKGIENGDIPPTYEYIRSLREELTRRNIELT